MRLFKFSAMLLSGLVSSQAFAVEKKDPVGPVSFYRDIRPILQVNCHGCHQPAKAKGDYVMTGFDRLITPGESGKKPLVSKKPAESSLLSQIMPVNGEAEMPKGKPPLEQAEIELIKKWILEGASDDTPANAIQRFSSENPPVYDRQPVVTSLHFSPDNKWIAVAGFHEVLLHKADGSGIEARLVGLAERIQSVRFSPDGKKLAVSGGQPGRVGEVQIWDVEKKNLLVSIPIGFDTAYGVSWSPDGKMVAVGLPDKTTRAFDAGNGKQVMRQGSHDDWVLGTVFSKDGSHIISVSRDMSTKLTDVASQRFIDNITSITPGALRGGLQTVARHPEKDEILVGGADGEPRIFQIFRTAARKIGDNANLLRKFPPLDGRIFSVDYSADGKMIAAGASLDGRGTINIYAASFDSTVPTNILKAYEKTVGEYSKEEREAIEKFTTSEVKLLSSVTLSNSSVYAVAFSPDGKIVAAAGGDGNLRMINAASGQISREIAVAPISTNQTSALASSKPILKSTPQNESSKAAVSNELEPGAPIGLAGISILEINPKQIEISSRNERVQMIVSAKLDSGEIIDVTRLAAFEVTDALATVSREGQFKPLKAGSGSVIVTLAKARTAIPVKLKALPEEFHADFIRDVNPLLAKMGCSAGTCHGSKDGRNGFKLSLRGYDPEYDVRSLTDDLSARRINLASPDESLMLLKATGAVPHEGGQRTPLHSDYYEILRQWVADGARLRAETPKVTQIKVYPENPVVQQIGSRQQIRVVATYADGMTRDVTAEAFIESGNGDVASTTNALITALRRGEAPILARYEGSYAATTLTVMGDRKGFTWKEPLKNNRIDELVADKWKRMKILPSELCSDAEFIRRVSLDLTGLPPSSEDVTLFLANKRDSRSKRDALIEKLLNSPDYVDHWANKWADLLLVNRKFLGEEGAKIFRGWIRQQVENNTPYDDFVRKIITATGSNKENPAASYWKILREPTEAMETTTHLFLATRFNCNKCHDHPFERWTQDQYYQLSQFFARVDFKKDDSSGDKKVGGSAVEGAKPLFELIMDKSEGDVKHDRTGKVVPPQFPFPSVARETPAKPTRREELAAWMTSPDNRYFAMSYVNRLWGYLLGVGLVEPLDDIRAGNPPGNPELLDHLTREFVESGFNTRHIIRQICQSRTYQLSLTSNPWNVDDKVNFSHATARRLPAEVLLDSVYKITGSIPHFPGVPAGTRAAQLPDSGVDLPSGFLANLGRPARETACECERSNDIKFGSILSLLSGPAVSGAISDPKNGIAKLVEQQPDDRKLVEELYLRILNRTAAESEIETAMKLRRQLGEEHQRQTEELKKQETGWAARLPALEKERLEGVTQGEKALTDYMVERAPKMVAAQRERNEKIQKLELQVRELQPAAMDRMETWEADIKPDRRNTLWFPAEVKEVSASGSAKLEKLADGSVRSRASAGELPDYTVNLEVKMTNITGFKLEVLPDENLPHFGPGHQRGDFLLSEIVLDWAAKTNAAKMQRAKITNGVAGTIADGFDIKHVFDGKSEQGRKEGWSIGSKPGEPHWAAFAFEKPIGESDVSVIKFVLQHRYEAPYEVGRFRIWVTTNPAPLNEGLPSGVAKVLDVTAQARTGEQNEILFAHYRLLDREMRQMEQQLALSRKPLPEDLRLKELELNLSRVTRPIATDPALVQLRQDVAMSAKQLQNIRLMVAQDLAWALINTPSFLFNR